ncbi:hypothetical protein L218DRAFT_1078311 [Marasmius fiardii PR-910]|nr:hypothetical protein L218DRAFT_1078311 [Marasmius fiardii PR-910]
MSSLGRAPAILVGPPVVALSLSCILFGILCVQVYLYRVRFPRDPLTLQVFVGFIFLADFVQIILLHIFSWEIFVTGKAIQGDVVTPTSSSGIHSILTCIISAMVQNFFAWRIYNLRKNSILVKFVVVLIVLLAILQSVSGITGVSLFLVATSGTTSSADLLRKLSIFVELWLIGAVVCDLFIAVAMTWILILFRRDSINRTTKSLIKSVILRSVETGIVTFIFTLIDLVLFLLYPDNYLFMVFDRSLSKIYTNALLLSLNARRAGDKVTTMDWATSGSFHYSNFERNAGLRFSVVSSRRYTSTAHDTNEVELVKPVETEDDSRFETGTESYRLSNVKDHGHFVESPSDERVVNSTQP